MTAATTQTLSQIFNGGNVRYQSGAVFTSGKALYEAAKAKGEKDRIDVGHIILNYAFAQKDFALGNMALKCLPKGADGGSIVNNVFLPRSIGIASQMSKLIY